MTLVSLAAISAHAYTEDVLDLGKKAQVSDRCAQKILTQATRVCNSESYAEEKQNREHKCFYNYDSTTKEGNQVTVVFSTGDAMEYDFLVSITDEADQNDCTFIVQRTQP